MGVTSTTKSRESCPGGLSHLSRWPVLLVLVACPKIVWFHYVDCSCFTTYLDVGRCPVLAHSSISEDMLATLAPSATAKSSWDLLESSVTSSIWFILNVAEGSECVCNIPWFCCSACCRLQLPAPRLKNDLRLNTSSNHVTLRLPF
jgi:hypothetical protein